MKLCRLTLSLVASVILIAPGAARSAATYRILVTNDDGVRAPGIGALAEALKSLGEVTVVAPSDNQSAKSHSLTISDPIYLDQVELTGGLAAFALAATPASCVKVALAAVVAEKPDLVVSGINRGYNLGMTSYVSGTVGAAREAALHGIPAIASSLDIAGHPNYQTAAQYTERVAALVKQRGIEKGVFLNVNIPAGSPPAIKGMMIATQSSLTGTERYVEQRTPNGRRYFWNVYEDSRADVEGTDVWATSQGYVAVTPLRVGEFGRKTFDDWKKILK